MSGMIRAPGTATFTNNSATVTGSGTDWTVSARAGALIRSKSNNVFYEILAVNSDTSITLVENWSGTTGASGFEILPWFSGEDDAPTAISVQIAQFLSAYSELFAVSGNSKTQTFNKGTSGSNAGAVFQIAGVGYFRVGMFGDTVFRLERSTDGTNWTAVWAVDRSTGAITITPTTLFNGAVGVNNVFTVSNNDAYFTDGVNNMAIVRRGAIDLRSADGWNSFADFYKNNVYKIRLRIRGDNEAFEVLNASYGTMATFYQNGDFYAAGSLNIAGGISAGSYIHATAPNNGSALRSIGPSTRFRMIPVSGGHVLDSVNTAESGYSELTIGSSALTLATNGAGRVRIDDSNFYPLTDSSINLGGGANRWAAAWFNNLRISGNTPDLIISDNNAGTNEKNWQLYADGATLTFFTLDDGITSSAAILQFNRSGNAPSSIVVGASVIPTSDNAHNLGWSGGRWGTLYAATGTINTSDQKEKTPLRALTAAEKRVARKIFGMIGVFQWLSAVAEKGEDGARLHIGVTAQALRQAFTDEGLDPSRYGVWCRDPIMVKVKKTRTVTRPKMETRTVETTEVVVEDGVPVQKIVTREEKRQAVVMVPVLDANGQPVMQPPSQKIGPDGNPMFTEPVFKLDAAGKVMLTDPVFALDEKGKPLLTRDGKQIMISPPQPIVEKAPEPVMNEPRPLLHPVPQVEEVEEEYEEQEESGEFREGIRPDQLYAFVTAGAAEFVQEQQMQIVALEQRLAALEGA